MFAAELERARESACYEAELGYVLRRAVEDVSAGRYETDFDEFRRSVTAQRPLVANLRITDGFRADLLAVESDRVFGHITDVVGPLQTIFTTCRHPSGVPAEMGLERSRSGRSTS